MKHLKQITLAVMLVIALVLAATPVAAQQNADLPLNTITVIGSGSAYGTPDIANIAIGVERRDVDISVAYTQANDAINAVIEAIVAVGIAREDIQTTGINIYQEHYPMEPSMMEPGMVDRPTDAIPSIYNVNNQLRITVRDIALAAEVINTAVEAGANNVYGLNFSIDDRAGLESEARIEAMTDAQKRAEELAAIIGAELGEVVIISEGFGGGAVPFDMPLAAIGLGGGGAPVEPGQLSVTMQVQVTYSINR